MAMPSDVRREDSVGRVRHLPHASSRWIGPASAAVAVLNALILWHFYDRYWYPVDEGNYAHVAERLLKGEVLHLQIQDLHPGYIHFVNAAAFWLFGLDLVSLRYPLALASFAQSCLVFALLSRRDVLLAAAGSVAVTALGVVQFLNPTAHWYSLFLTVALACWLTWVPRSHPVRTIGAGLLVGMVTMFRQLTGVWVGMAVLVLLLQEQSTDVRGRRAALARIMLALMLVALIAYLMVARGPELGGVLLMASWPIAILGVMLAKVRTASRAAAVVAIQLLAGACTAALPLVAYHLVHHSFAAWLDDVVLASAGLTQLDFFEGGWFSVLSTVGLYQALTSLEFTKIVNGLYWALLPLVAAVNGVCVLRQLRGRPELSGLFLPVIAAFYALVSLHLEGPTYLYYTVGLSLAAGLWFAAVAPGWQRGVCAAVTVAVTIVALVFHAGQSYHRTPIEVLEGRHSWMAAATICEPFRRSSLKVEQVDCDSYTRLVAAIQAEAPPGSRILALPSDAELYFLADRPSPVRFYNSAFGIRTHEDLSAVLDLLARHPPELVTFRPDDKYNTPASYRIMEYVRSAYRQFDTIGGVELYSLRTTARPEVSW